MSDWLLQLGFNYILLEIKLSVVAITSLLHHCGSVLRKGLGCGGGGGETSRDTRHGTKRIFNFEEVYDKVIDNWSSRSSWQHEIVIEDEMRDTEEGRKKYT